MVSTVFIYLVVCLVVVLNSAKVQAAKGVDVSALTSKNSFTCLKNAGYTRAIVRAYMEAWGANPGGKVDPSFVQNYQNAKAAGMQVDMYVFPCTGRSTCKSPATQVSEVIKVMNDNKMAIGTIWFDVEVDPQANNWPSATSNKQTLTAFKNAWNGSKLNWGVYSSLSQWSQITGSGSWVMDSSKPLWYAHYDNTANFNDFGAFGGWTSPKMKQYAGSTSTCSANVDLNYFP